MTSKVVVKRTTSKFVAATKKASNIHAKLWNALSGTDLDEGGLSGTERFHAARRSPTDRGTLTREAEIARAREGMVQREMGVVTQHARLHCRHCQYCVASPYQHRCHRDLKGPIVTTLEGNDYSGRF